MPLGRMIYTTDFKKSEEIKIVYSEEFYSDKDYTQAELRKLVPSLNEDKEKEPS